MLAEVADGPLAGVETVGDRDARQVDESPGLIARPYGAERRQIPPLVGELAIRDVARQREARLRQQFRGEHPRVPRRDGVLINLVHLRPPGGNVPVRSGLRQRDPAPRVEVGGLDGLRRRQCVVEFAEQLVVVGRAVESPDVRVTEVSYRRDLLEEVRRHRVQKARGNDVPRQRLPAVGVVELLAELREVAQVGGRGGKPDRVLEPRHLFAVGVKGEEEERSVAADRPAQRSSALVLVVLRAGGARLVPRPAIGIQRRVVLVGVR